MQDPVFSFNVITRVNLKEGTWWEVTHGRIIPECPREHKKLRLLVEILDATQDTHTIEDIRHLITQLIR